MAETDPRVAEFQGLYGPFTVAERVIQKIWLHGDFDRSRLVLLDGRPLRIETAGDWNLLGGPDFRAAGLTIAGERVTGDVEVHFHVGDWRAHGHGANPTFAGVALHVVLFPPSPSWRPEPDEPPVLVLLPYLHRDLEEYAADEALEQLTARDDWRRFAQLSALAPEDVRSRLEALAMERWSGKVRTAARRIERLGWHEAAHHTALEILGYRHNRGPMLTLAARRSLAEWARAEPDGWFDEMGDDWRRHGVRPANHPRTRLRQYAAWVRDRPDWPAALLRVGEDALHGWAGPALSGSTALTRRAGLTAWARRLAEQVVAGQVGGTRFNTLVCDGFLPLLAARREAEAWQAAWFHWFVGDQPAQLARTLRRLGVSGRPAQSHCHGLAQGLLGWLLKNENRA